MDRKYVLEFYRKKLLMALTGFCLCGFLITHLFGNLLLYSGKETFNAYSERLNSLGLISRFIELGLLFFAVIHVIIGAILFFQNLKARPVQYIVNKRAGGRTIGSATMPYYRFFVFCTFVIFLSDNFHLQIKPTPQFIQIVSSTFTKPGYVTNLYRCDFHHCHPYPPWGFGVPFRPSVPTTPNICQLSG